MVKGGKMHGYKGNPAAAAGKAAVNRSMSPRGEEERNKKVPMKQGMAGFMDGPPKPRKAKGEF